VDKQQVIEKIARDVFPDGPTVQKSNVAVLGDDVVLFDPATNPTEPEAVYAFSQTDGVCSLVDVPKQTAEQWLTGQGYSSTRLVTLLDLEARLTAAQKSSPKLAATRAWTNDLLAASMADAAPRYVWLPAPYSFSDVTAEAFAVLTQ
jgi:hypothetical protein